MDKKNIWVGRTAYQIMPDRFFREGGILEHINGRKLKSWDDRMPDWKPDIDGEYRNLYFYGGNIKGIESKLEYLKGLGFDAIYLTPINQSISYHHYDVIDHLVIDSWLGTWEDFKSMCDTAKKLDILIIVDLVFNHTGVNSIYFNDNKYKNWYKREEDGSPVFWWGFTDLPECNTLSKDYQDAMTKVVEKYLENGATGVRLDLGENLPKEFLLAVQRVKEKYPDTIFIGEMWEIATDKRDPKVLDGQLDSVMNYPIADAILRWARYGYNEHFIYNFNRVYKEYPENVQNVLLNNIGTHDTPTTLTMLAGDKMNSNVFDKRIWDIESPWLQNGIFNTYGFREFEAKNDELNSVTYEHGRKLLKLALTLLYSIPGIPCVYQGTEIGETGYKDPFNRKPYAWKKENKEITDFVRKLGKFRAENKDVLATGKAELVHVTTNLLVLDRISDSGKVRVILNRGNTHQNIENFYLDCSETVLQLNNNNSKELINPFSVLIIREH